MTRLRWMLVWCLIGVLLVLGGWAWRVRPLPVPTATVRSQPLLRTLQFTARVKTPQRVDVGSTITGRVQLVRVKQGDAFEANDALIELESQELRAAWLQAQASVPQAQATARAADRDLQRVQELVAAQFYSQSKLDDAKRLADVAHAQVDAARASVEVARAKLDQTTVRAPGPGRVLVRSVEPGQIVQAGKVLLSVSVAGPLEMVAQVDERFLSQLQVGQRAKVVADAYPAQAFDARLDRLAPSVDAQKGAVEATLVVQGLPPTFLREDMTLSVEVNTGQRTQARVLPLSALRGTASQAASSQGTVLVIEQGHARERAVTLGLRTLADAEVLSGLADGDVLVLDSNVLPGARVKPKTVTP